VRFAALIDGTAATAPRQARALAAFLADGLAGDGLTGDLAGETVIFVTDDREAQELVALAPTRDVRLVRVASRRPDLMAESLSGAARGGEIDLFLAPAGPWGAELLTRLACRSDGAVLTGVLDAALTGVLDAALTGVLDPVPEGALDPALSDVPHAGPAGALGRAPAGARLQARANVYSNHMVGRFELSRRPWCLAIDASWTDGRPLPTPAHEVLSDSAAHVAPGDAGPDPLSDVELEAAPPAGGLADSRFVVVAGYGAGGPDGVARIARAARRMGAEFGVSRPVAMNAWAPMDRLIGVSGTRIAPAVCLVVAASGAPALHWGIERAGFIAAVNSDDRAPIAGNADAVVVDDGVAVIEELAALIDPQGEVEKE
jgi:electron transfer flavoprotein alpha subunit